MKKEPMEELTDTMHATFNISDEDDRKFRVWSALEIEASGDYTLEEALKMQQVTMEDYYLYADTYPDPDEEIQKTKQNEYYQFKYYKGEEKSPFKLQDGNLKCGWWAFEMGYAQSVLADKIQMYEYFKFTTKDFTQYKYFKGEIECPFKDDSGNELWDKSRWWKLEKFHWKHLENNEKDMPFVEFFMLWIWNHAAPNSMTDLDTHNPYVDDYVYYAPITDYR